MQEGDLAVRQYTYSLTQNDFHIKDHVVDDCAIMPGAAYLELVRSSVCINFSEKQKYICLKDVFWLIPIQLKQAETTLIVDLIPVQQATKFIMKIGETIHCQGMVTHLDFNVSKMSVVDLSVIRSCCIETVPSFQLYDLFKKYGLNYGLSLQTIKQFQYNEREAIAQLTIAKEDEQLLAQGYLHPAIIDGALQTVVGLTIHTLPKEWGQLVPYYVEAIHIFADLTPICYAHARLVNLIYLSTINKDEYSLA